MNSHTKPSGDDVQANCEAGASAGNQAGERYAVSEPTLSGMISEIQVVRAHLDILNSTIVDRETIDVSNETLSFALIDLWARLGRIEDTLGNIGLWHRS